MKRFVSFVDPKGVTRFGKLISIDPTMYHANGGVARVLVGNHEWTVQHDRLTDIPVADGLVMPTDARLKAEVDSRNDEAVMAGMRALGGRCLLGDLANHLDWYPVKLAAVTRRMQSSGSILASKVMVGDRMVSMLTLRESVKPPPE